MDLHVILKEIDRRINEKKEFQDDAEVRAIIYELENLKQWIEDHI